VKATGCVSDEGKSSEADTRSGSPALGIALTLIVIAAAVVRFRASAGDLWLDEIWSLHFASSVLSPVEILTQIHHDNNHILNTLLLYFLGDRENWMIYRIPAIAAGTVAVICSSLIARRWARLEALTAVLLTGSSYLMIHYSSEARGYALVVPFALLSFLMMRRCLEGHRLAPVLFWLMVVLGFLSHLIFVHVYIALLVWSLVRFVKTSRRWSQVALNVVRCHAVPIGFVIALYFVHVRHIVISGGPVFSALGVVVRTAALTLGAPETGPMAVAAAGAVLVIIVFGLLMLARDRSDSTVFFAVVIVLSPGLLLLIRPPQLLYVRYFLISVAFLVLLLSRLLASLYRCGPVGRVVYVAVMLAIMSGGGVYTADLLKHGRGHYVDALTYMVENTPGNVVTIGSDHDFRNKTILDYYAPRFGGIKRITYYDKSMWPQEGPDWLILHNWARDVLPPGAVTDLFGHAYSLTRSYRYARLSGWNWFLYRREQ